MLHHRVGEAGDVRFLEGIAAQERNQLLPAQNDDRRRIHLRREQPGDRVGRAGARSHEHHAGLAGCPGIPVRHVGGTLFVPS